MLYLLFVFIFVALFVIIVVGFFNRISCRKGIKRMTGCNGIPLCFLHPLKSVVLCSVLLSSGTAAGFWVWMWPWGGRAGTASALLAMMAEGLYQRAHMGMLSSGP